MKKLTYLLLLVCVSSFAQIKGTVSDEKGNPILFYNEERAVEDNATITENNEDSTRSFEIHISKISQLNEQESNIVFFPFKNAILVNSPLSANLIKSFFKIIFKILFVTKIPPWQFISKTSSPV